MKQILKLDPKYYCKSDKYKNFIQYNDFKDELSKDYYYDSYSHLFQTKELKALGIKYVKAWISNKEAWQWLVQRPDKKKVVLYHASISKKRNEYDAIYMSDSDKKLFEWQPWSEADEAIWEAYSNTVEDIDFNVWKDQNYK